MPAVQDVIPVLRERCRDLAVALGASNDLGRKVRLAVSEAVTNVVQHAYPEATGEVLVRAAQEDGALVVEVVDHGVGFGNAAPSSGLGMGLVIMDRSSEDMVVRAGPRGGTSVLLRFALP